MAENQSKAQREIDNWNATVNIGAAGRHMINNWLISSSAVRILKTLAEPGSINYAKRDGRQWWLGHARISGTVVKELIDLNLLSLAPTELGPELWCITEEGRKVARTRCINQPSRG